MKCEPTNTYEREFLKKDEQFSVIPIGSRTKFYPILQQIEDEIEKENEDYKRVVAKHFPVVSDGIACALFHGIIQTGKANTPNVNFSFRFRFCFHSRFCFLCFFFHKTKKKSRFSLH